MTDLQYAEQYARQFSIYEKRVYPIFLRALRAQINPVLDWLRNISPTPQLDLLLKTAFIRDAIITSYGMIGVLSAKREFRFMRKIEGDIKADTDFDILISQWDRLFKTYATNYAYTIENGMTETTKELIREALEEGYELGYNGDQLAELLQRRVYDQISRNRAIMIARTETTTAANIGKELGARAWLDQQGQRGYKMWIGRVRRERNSHLLLNNTIIPIEEEWDMSGEKAVRPGDLRLSGANRINCRCTVQYISERRYLRMNK